MTLEASASVNSHNEDIFFFPLFSFLFFFFRCVQLQLHAKAFEHLYELLFIAREFWNLQSDLQRTRGF